MATKSTSTIADPKSGARAKRAAGEQASGSGPARERYHHGDLRRALIEAATRLITEGGSAALTVRAVAQAAGVSSAAPYRHFADREALLAEVLIEGFDALAARTEAARRAAPDERAALVALGLAYVDFAREHAAVYRLMFGPECRKQDHAELMAAGDRAFGVLRGAVQDAVMAGLLAPERAQPFALAGWSVSHGMATLHADGLFEVRVPGTLESNAKAVLNLMLSVLAPSPKP